MGIHLSWESSSGSPWEPLGSWFYNWFYAGGVQTQSPDWQEPGMQPLGSLRTVISQAMSSSCGGYPAQVNPCTQAPASPCPNAITVAEDGAMILQCHQHNTAKQPHRTLHWLLCLYIGVKHPFPPPPPMPFKLLGRHHFCPLHSMGQTRLVLTCVCAICFLARSLPHAFTIRLFYEWCRKRLRLDFLK